jgi:hypothetical protein
MTTQIKQKLRIDERFSWSFVGVILAILFGLFSLYSVFHENRPRLVFEIESQSDVFDLHRPLRDLSLSFRGQDVQQQNLNVRILTVRLWNKGGVDILQSHYDQQEPWGIRVEPGQVIEVRVGSNNSQYLASHIEPKITADNTVMFNKVIFERDKFVTLELLVLHHKDSPPRIGSFGKIAGLNEIVVVDSSGQGDKPGFWHQAIYGSPLIHVVRFAGYVVFLIAAILGIVGITSAFGTLGQRRRRKRISRLLGTNENEEIGEMVKETYAHGGVDALKHFAGILQNPKLLQRILDDEKKTEAFLANISEPGQESDVRSLSSDVAMAHRIRAMEAGPLPIPYPSAFSKLVKAGKIKIVSPEKMEIDNQILQMLDRLIRRLEAV